MNAPAAPAVDELIGKCFLHFTPRAPAGFVVRFGNAIGLCAEDAYAMEFLPSADGSLAGFIQVFTAAELRKGFLLFPTARARQSFLDQHEEHAADAARGG
jgi:hypothetical protein